MSENTKFNLKSYLLVVYGITLVISWGFIYQQRSDGGSLSSLLYQYSAWLSFAALALVPVAIPCLFALTRKCMRRKWYRLMISFLSGGIVAVIHLLLLLDLMILSNFGYHINGLVINLLVVPGGYEAMGIDDTTFAIALAGIVFVAIADNFLSYELIYRQRLQFVSRKGQGCLWAFSGCLAGCLMIALLLTGIADFKVNVPVLSVMDTFPVFPKLRMRKFLRCLRVEEPKRDEIVSIGCNIMRDSSLAYPQEPLLRDCEHRKYNVVWLVGESLRADLCSQRIMPNLWKLSQQGWRFTEHYSGGNGTRPGMFSMFYGLYGNYWHAFLHRSRQPIFFDWMREDGYAFKCQTSARFTYPEFDRTIFSGMKSEELREVSGGEAWHRDEVMTDEAIAFVDSHAGNGPFFLFCFFESTHAPYSFPEKNALECEYLRQFNYVTVSSKDARGLYNRDVNAANHVDRQIGRLLEALAEHGIKENTIIVVTGDHGEEFYEKGRLGHNSAFVQEQIKVPLVITAPGLSPNVYKGLSHHTDIIPTLAPYFGVSSSPEIYSVGGNLADGGYVRNSFITVGWDIAVLATLTHKFVLPIGRKHFYCRKKITTFDDVACPEFHDEFYKKYASELAKAQQDMHRFIRTER